MKTSFLLPDCESSFSSIMSTFSTSTPAKKTRTPSPDDSEVSIQLSELGEGDQESDKMLTEGSDSIKGEKEMEITLEIDDGEQHH